MAYQKLKIKLTGYDSSLIQKAADEICKTARRTNATISGPVPLPRDVLKLTVNRSPHIDKESREQFEIRTHKRLVEIYPTSQTMDALMKLDLPAGVGIDIKIVEA